MVQSYVKHTGRDTLFTNGRPAKEWVTGFEKRHRDELRRRTPESLSTTRAKCTTKENVQQFYDMYEQVLRENDLLDKPWRLWNIDETGLTCDQMDQMVYVGPDVKNAYCLCPPGSKTMYTVLFGANAIGFYLPPFIIMVADKMIK